jgi:hypothetical protein
MNHMHQKKDSRNHISVNNTKADEQLISVSLSLKAIHLLLVTVLTAQWQISSQKQMHCDISLK